MLFRSEEVGVVEVAGDVMAGRWIRIRVDRGAVPLSIPLQPGLKPLLLLLDRGIISWCYWHNPN